MHNIGPDILGAYDAMPPPEVGIKFRPKKFLKKAGRGLKKAGRVAVKIHTAPIKAVAKAGKFAARKLATLAAIPIRRSFRTLGMRRAKLLSWKGRKSLNPNVTEKRAAGAWALAKMRSKGPIGKFGVKVLQFTRGATLGDIRAALPHVINREEVSMVGLTGAEIAAAAAAVVAAVTQITRSLNKPGEAPADPRQAEPEEAPNEPSEATSDDEGEESSSGWAGAANALAMLGNLLGTVLIAGGPRGKKARRYPDTPPPPVAAQDRLREAAARDGYKPLKKAYRMKRLPTITDTWRRIE